MAPEIYGADSLAMREVAWASIDGLVAAKWCRLGYRLHRRHGAREERQPYLDVVWNDDVEDLVRTKLGRPRKASSYSAQWRALLERCDPPFTEPALTKLASAVIEVSGRPVEEVFSRFLSIRLMAGEPLLLREVSSRVFWGLSKLLDGRTENIAILLGVDECPLPEQPIVLNVHVANPPSSLLFVENHVSFERLKQRNDLHDCALIFCSGFRGAARRLREPGGASLYYTRNSPDASIAHRSASRLLFCNGFVYQEGGEPAYFGTPFDKGNVTTLSLRIGGLRIGGNQPGDRWHLGLCF
jgi:hypothetical protein